MGKLAEWKQKIADNHEIQQLLRTFGKDSSKSSNGSYDPCPGSDPWSQASQCVGQPSQGYAQQSLQLSVSGSTLPASKKGVGLWQVPSVEADLAKCNVSWFYSWTPITYGVNDHPGMEFVPMIWGRNDLHAEAMQQASQHQHLLGFNEPDESGQANMSVEEAINAWPMLMATGLRLGSPGIAHCDCSDHDWLGQFMYEAATRNYRVDFMCVHFYTRTDTFDVKENVETLRAFLHKVYNKWRRPIWLTEFAMMNWWGGSIGMYAPAEAQADFARAAAAMMNELPFVERYAWFALHNDDPAGTNGLIDKSSNFRPTGHAYQGVK